MSDVCVRHEERIIDHERRIELCEQTARNSSESMRSVHDKLDMLHKRTSTQNALIPALSSIAYVVYEILRHFVH